MASLFDRFLINFGRFWEASWDAKSIKNRLKRHQKTDAKKKASTRRLGGILGRPDGFGRSGWVVGSHGGQRNSGPLIEVNRGNRGTWRY